MLEPSELRKAAVEKIREAEQVQQQADDAKRDLNPVEEQKILKLLADAEALQNEAGAIEVQRGAFPHPDRGATWRLPGGSATHNLRSAATALDRLLPRMCNFATGSEIPGDGSWDNKFRKIQTRVPRSGGKRYHDLFGGGISNDGFGSFEEFLKVVHSGLYDPRLEQASMGGKTGSGGGFLVPTQFAARMLDASLEGEVVRPRCRVEPMTSDTKRVAGWDSRDNSTSAPYGGFSGQWLAENAEATEVDAKVRAIELHANKLAIYTAASNELVADGLSFEEMLGSALIRALAWHLDAACLTGTGAGQPRGVLNDPAKIEVAKETSQAADTLVLENVVKIYSRLHPASHANAVWVANPTIVPQLFTMQNKVKNVAGTENVGGSPIFMVNAGPTPSQTLLGLPLLYSEKLPPLGDAGDIILADFSQYVLGLRQEIVLEKSIDAGWSRDQSKYRVKVRADGQGAWAAPFTPKNGSTLSWIVTLAERA